MPGLLDSLFIDLDKAFWISFELSVQNNDLIRDLILLLTRFFFSSEIVSESYKVLVL